MAAQGRARSLVGTSGASNDNGNSLAHPNDQICVLTVGLQFVAGGVQIGGYSRGREALGKSRCVTPSHRPRRFRAGRRLLLGESLCPSSRPELSTAAEILTS
jgi:hypothetical protein